MSPPDARQLPGPARGKDGDHQKEEDQSDSSASHQMILPPDANYDDLLIRRTDLGVIGSKARTEGDSLGVRLTIAFAVLLTSAMGCRAKAPVASPSPSPTEVALTPQEYVEQADEICRGILKEFPSEESSPGESSEAIEQRYERSSEFYGSLADEMDDLNPPESLNDEVEEFLTLVSAQSKNRNEIGKAFTDEDSEEFDRLKNEFTQINEKKKRSGTTSVTKSVELSLETRAI